MEKLQNCKIVDSERQTGDWAKTGRLGIIAAKAGEAHYSRTGGRGSVALHSEEQSHFDVAWAEQSSDNWIIETQTIY